MHLEAFSVENYKNFRKPVRLDGLGAVNVIHGDNDVGKSNLIEAMQLFFFLLSATGGFDPKSESAAAELLGQNGVDPATVFDIRGRAAIELRGRIRVDPVDVARTGFPEPVSYVSSVVTLGASGGLSVALDVGGLAEGWVHGNTKPVRRLMEAITRAPPRRANGSQFAVVAPDRRFVVPETMTRRSRMPQDLLLQLYDARDATNADTVAHMRRFVESMKAFEAVTGPGQFLPVFHRQEQRADLIFEGPRGRMHVDMLGSGVRQVATLIAEVFLRGADIVAIEEPEIGLRHQTQLLLRKALYDSVGKPGAPRQLFIVSHSPAFESPTGFYSLERDADGDPVAIKRERALTSAALGITDAAPDGKTVPVGYVTSDGLVEVPEFARKRLGVEKGGGVVFVEGNAPDSVELWSDAAWLRTMGAADDVDRG